MLDVVCEAHIEESGMVLFDLHKTKLYQVSAG